MLLLAMRTMDIPTQMAHLCPALRHRAHVERLCQGGRSSGEVHLIALVSRWQWPVLGGFIFCPFRLAVLPTCSDPDYHSVSGTLFRHFQLVRQMP